MNRMRSSVNLITRFSKTFKSYYYNYYSSSTVNRHISSHCSNGWGYIRTFNSFGFSSFLRTYGCTHTGGHPKSIYYKMEDEVKHGSDSNPLILTTNYTCTKNGKEVEEELTSIKKGDTVDLSDLLFTKNRDYLIKCNDDQRVKAEQLVGKVVVIYFDSVMEMDEIFLTSLMRIYKDLQPYNSFEIVFVDVNDSYGSEILYYEDTISRMPWTAIPLSDITFRKNLKRRFGYYKISYMGDPIVVDPTGMILQCPAYEYILDYGALGYPFSDERIDFLKSKDALTAKQPSLQTLLASPERDYLISNKGDKVPIHTLEDKVVALYFYEEGFTDEQITQELKLAYKELAKNNKKFEVVLIYCFHGERIWGYKSDESFWKTFKTMPWLALPNDDSHHRMLQRIFKFPYELEGLEFSLIILGRHMEFIEPFGVFILQNFKISAYPFSRYKVAKLMAEEAKDLKLEMLWDSNSVFGGKFGSPVRFSEFAGKRVIIFFDHGWPSTSDVKIAETLKERYIHMKGSDDEFEVIHITMLSSKTDHVANMPWFVQPLSEDFTECLSILFNSLFFRYCYKGRASLIAFDRDGRVIRKTVIPTFEDMNFPFYAGDLEKEALSQLVTLMGWNNFEEYTPEMIYSYKREKENK